MSRSRLLADLPSDGLDDYEEGTWTPSFEGSSGSAGTASFSANSNCHYTKIGRLVHAWGGGDFTDLGSWGGSVYMNGLPFLPASTGGYPNGTVVLRNSAWDGDYLTIEVGQSADRLTLLESNKSANTTVVAFLDLVAGSSTINFSVWYIT